MNNHIAVIYWSGTGNTADMAQAVAEGAKSAGATVSIFEVREITPEAAAAFDALALGCPAMGSEVLEEYEFEPFFGELEGKLSGKDVALFGSYGWGDGQWMRDWTERVEDAGASVCNGEGLAIQERPDEEGLKACRSMGAALVNG